MTFGKREVALLAATAATVGAAWWFGFRPAGEREAELRAAVAERRAELALLDEATADAADLERQVDELQSTIDYFEAKLPRESEIGPLLGDVSRAARHNRLEIRRFEPERVVRGGHYSELPVKIELAGDFEGFYAYLLELERLARITRTTAMTLEKVQDRNGAMKAAMTLSIYFEPNLAAK